MGVSYNPVRVNKVAKGVKVGRLRRCFNDSLLG